LKKKIHQERTQNSKIDPSLGKNDAIGMEKEIRRMKHKLKLIEHEQEGLIREMETTIYKREDIMVKYQYGKNNEISHTTSAKKQMTNADLKKKKKNLEKKLFSFLKETSKFCESLEKKKKMFSEVLSDLNETTERHHLMESSELSLHSVIEIHLQDIEYLQAKIYLNKHILQKYESIEEIESFLINSDEQFETDKQILILNKKASNIQNTIAGLRLQFPHLEKVLSTSAKISSYLISEVQTL